MAEERVAKKSVEEGHSELYHYTTAAGLLGIISTQRLRATHISYLNDAEEQIGFFSRRLPTVLRAPVEKAINARYETQQGQEVVKRYGGKEEAAQRMIEEITKAIRQVSVAIGQPYVTSFCSATAHTNENDGLLSQWRGYGPDGGYAVVFRTKDLLEFIKVEIEKFQYQSVNWGDTDYDDGAAPHPEQAEWEGIIQSVIEEFILRPRRENLEALYNPVAALSCRYKHGGFRQEAEVRIVAIPLSGELYEESVKRGDKRRKKPIDFVAKDGLLVPHIWLFHDAEEKVPKQLPIARIIVGPHPDRLKRAASVRMLLEQQSIRAEVMVSDIPILGL